MFESIVWSGGPIKSTTSQPGTRERLLKAAGAVFAQQGFHNATIREICREAGVNVAAVNYHFRDKEHLYEAVLRYAHHCAIETHPPEGDAGSDSCPEARLRGFIHSFLRRLTDDGRPAWHGVLMIREITAPTAALDSLVEASVRPLYEQLCAIIGDLLGPRANLSQVRLCTSSVVGQCMHFRVSREVLLRLNPELSFTPENVEAIADHVARFSLAAIRCFRAELEGRS